MNPGSADTPTQVQWTRGGQPSDEEVVAIVAAIEATWPRPDAVSAPQQAPRWRFSGRWWSKPVPLRRARPW